MRLVSVIILFITTILGGVTTEHTRFKRLMYAMCPPNFIGIGSLCYYISNYKVSWLEAQFECKDKNSRLAEPIKSADKKLRKHLQRYDTERTDIWIGGTFDSQTQKWTWGYSGNDMKYNSFNPKNIKNSKDVHYQCAVLNPVTNYKWSEKSCVEQNRFICQHKMPRVSEKNRMKVYTRWNETYPNQLANEIVLELSDDDDQRSFSNLRRRRMHPKIIPTTTLAPPVNLTTENLSDINIEFVPHEIKDHVVRFVPPSPTNVTHNGNNFTLNENNLENNITATTTTPVKLQQQKTPFDLKIEEKRRKARERRKERKLQKERERQKRQHEIQELIRIKTERQAEQKKIHEEVENTKMAKIIELEALEKQLEEHENERKQNEIDQKRIHEINEKIIEDNKAEQNKIENHKNQHHEIDSKKYEKSFVNLDVENERLKFIKQQQEEFKKIEEKLKEEDRKRLDEELVRLKAEQQLREQRQKKREEEIKKRQLALKQQEEEEKRLQEELKKQEQEELKAKEEENRKREEQKRLKEEEEIRKKSEKEQKLLQKKLRRQKAEEEARRFEQQEKKRKHSLRERLAKLSPEEQIEFFRMREERRKRKRLASNQIENEVLIPE